MVTKTILVVDPDVTVGALLASILREEKYEVTTAESLKEAAAVVAASSFDLIITEAFGQKNQFDFDPSFLSEILLSKGKTPILLCSTYASFGTSQAKAYGFADVLPKPFDLDELLSKVAQILNNDGPLSSDNHKGYRNYAA